MRRRDVLGWSLMLGVSGPALLLAGCEKPGPDKPAAIKFGRDTCEHCTMLISEPSYAAELWDSKIGRYHLFDDVGCAAVFAAENQIADETGHRLWVANSEQAGQWLDARTSYYRTDGRSPMGYNYAATAASAPGRLTFAAMRQQAEERALCAPGGAARSRQG